MLFSHSGSGIFVEVNLKDQNVTLSSFFSSQITAETKVPFGGSKPNIRSVEESGYEELKWDQVRDGLVIVGGDGYDWVSVPYRKEIFLKLKSRNTVRHVVCEPQCKTYFKSRITNWCLIT
jgi:hypothetical protein